MNVSYSLNSFRFLEFIEGENDFSGNPFTRYTGEVFYRKY